MDFDLFVQLSQFMKILIIFYYEKQNAHQHSI